MVLSPPAVMFPPRDVELFLAVLALRGLRVLCPWSLGIHLLLHRVNLKNALVLLMLNKNLKNFAKQFSCTFSFNEITWTFDYCTNLVQFPSFSPEAWTRKAVDQALPVFVLLLYVVCMTKSPGQGSSNFLKLHAMAIRMTMFKFKVSFQEASVTDKESIAAAKQEIDFLRL